MQTFKPQPAASPEFRSVQIKFDPTISEAMRGAAQKARIPICRFAEQAIAFAIANMEVN